MSDTTFYSLKLVSKHCEFETTYTLKFSAKPPVHFIAGQWIHLGFPTESKDESKVHHMSFASAPGDALLEFTMDLGTGSWYKNHISALKPGDTIRAFKVSGVFVVDPLTDAEIIFLSGGIGITPVRSIIRDLQSKDARVSWRLLHVASTEFLYQNELAKLNPRQWRVHHSQIDGVWKDVIDTSPDAKYYISGSERFVEGMKEKLNRSGIASTQFITETFHS